MTISSDSGSLPIICSSDGSTVVFIDSLNVGFLAFSTDHGTTWTPISTPISALALAGSSTCQYLVISGTSGLYVSHTSGSNWTQRLTGLYGGLSMSSDGQTILASDGLHTTYVSNNGGTLFTIATTSTYLISHTSMSADGRVMLIEQNDVLISSDSGQTWTSQLPYLPSGFEGNAGVVSGNGQLMCIPETSVSHLIYILNGHFYEPNGSTGPQGSRVT